ncbi:hypothetical protein KSP40_PGU019067 [Platanthera guangdongensis]|uniref:Uncharacterized protein n=1 Tax=Platanthera guangdongensis TaxID=2320717 RepID=A0ABR2MFK7_9ASPA
MTDGGVTQSLQSDNIGEEDSQTGILLTQNKEGCRNVREEMCSMLEVCSTTASANRAAQINSNTWPFNNNTLLFIVRG